MQPAKEKKKSNHFNKKYMIKTVKYIRIVVWATRYENVKNIKVLWYEMR